MGSGKTTIGRQLANSLGREFFDSDREIEKRTGVDIPLIFEIEGEEGFRKRETKMLKELILRENIVLATGGGVILAEENRLLLKRYGYVIYLKTTSNKLYQRTKKDKKRPLLNTEDRMKTIEDLLEVRGPLYEEVADQLVESDGNSIKQIVQQIVNSLNTA